MPFFLTAANMPGVWLQNSFSAVLSGRLVSFGFIPKVDEFEQGINLVMKLVIRIL